MAKKFKPEQIEVLKKYGEDLQKKLIRYFEIWNKPMRARLPLLSYSKLLKPHGLNAKDALEYWEREGYLITALSEETNAQVVFPRSAELDFTEDEVLQFLVDFDTDIAEKRELRRQNILKIRRMEAMK